MPYFFNDLVAIVTLEMSFYMYSVGGQFFQDRLYMKHTAHQLPVYFQTIWLSILYKLYSSDSDNSGLSDLERDFTPKGKDGLLNGDNGALVTNGFLQPEG